MKKTITNLDDMLAFRLEGIYTIVRHLQTTIPAALKSTSDVSTKELLRSFFKNLSEQRLKLKRAFSYLLTGPYGRHSTMGTDAILPFEEISKMNIESSMRDILFTTSMQSAIQFMITTYTDSRYIAIRLEMDNVVALLDEMIELEENFVQRIRTYSAERINSISLAAD